MSQDRELDSKKFGIISWCFFLQAIMFAVLAFVSSLPFHFESACFAIIAACFGGVTRLLSWEWGFIAQRVPVRPRKGK